MLKAANLSLDQADLLRFSTVDLIQLSNIPLEILNEDPKLTNLDQVLTFMKTREYFPGYIELQCLSKTLGT